MCVYHTLCQGFFSSYTSYVLLTTSFKTWFSITVIVCGCALKQTLNLIILFFGANQQKEEEIYLLSVKKCNLLCHSLAGFLF